VQRLDLTGSRFGKLTAQWPAGRSCKRILWLCLCDCGNTPTVFALNLRRKTSKSCGCASSRTTMRARMTTHGQCKTPTYKTWKCMLYRCHSSKSDKWEYYGSRGIKVCERWYKFENFLLDMGYRPAGKTLDRIDNNGHYEPGNCRWATKQEQMLNTRVHRRKNIGPVRHNKKFFSDAALYLQSKESA
jgi:hypothetical protein